MNEGPLTLRRRPFTLEEQQKQISAKPAVTPSAIAGEMFFVMRLVLSVMVQRAHDAPSGGNPNRVQVKLWDLPLSCPLADCTIAT